MSLLEQGVWQDWWPIIYQAVALNAQDPGKYPLHPNFWGYYIEFGRHPHAPFPERILRASPEPRLADVKIAVGCANANLTAWLRRRVCYIEGLKPDPH